MEDFRSKSCGGNGKMQIEPYSSERPTTSSGMYELRSYSTSYASSMPQHHHQQEEEEQQPPAQAQIGSVGKDGKLKKGKGGASSSSSSKGWSLSDPELQRKKRVASYKVYAVEGKMKGSFRKSFRWLKDRYTQVIYGWR